MPPAKSHKADCALNIRARGLCAAGDPTPPDAALIASIAEQIATCCGHRQIKAYRLANGLTVKRAVERIHDLCRREHLGARGLTERS